MFVLTHSDWENRLAHMSPHDHLGMALLAFYGKTGCSGIGVCACGAWVDEPIILESLNSLDMGDGVNIYNLVQ